MPAERLLERLEFENGLLVLIHDASRPVAGDRWLIAFDCRASVALDAFGDGEEENFLQALELCRRVWGRELLDLQHRERNFIAAAQKEEVLRGLVASFKKDHLPYWQKPDFPRRMVLAKAREVFREPWKFGLSPEALAPVR